MWRMTIPVSEDEIEMLVSKGWLSSTQIPAAMAHDEPVQLSTVMP